MGSRPLDIAKRLNVVPEDIGTIKAARRKVVLSRIAQVAATVLAALAGFIAGGGANSISTTDSNGGYPYAQLLPTSVLLVGTSRKSWIAAAIVAVVAFMTFFAVSAEMPSQTFGVGTKYGVYHRK
ncbi:MAG: hypothetical protein MUO81_06945 [Thermoplasmata archaeon]|nr:hypothetical protein [Thermoplasmata archaeon]